MIIITIRIEVVVVVVVVMGSGGSGSGSGSSSSSSLLVGWVIGRHLKSHTTGCCRNWSWGHAHPYPSLPSPPLPIHYLFPTLLPLPFIPPFSSPPLVQLGGVLGLGVRCKLPNGVRTVLRIVKRPSADTKFLAGWGGSPTDRLDGGGMAGLHPGSAIAHHRQTYVEPGPTQSDLKNNRLVKQSPKVVIIMIFSFSAVTLLVGRREGHPACIN